MFLLFITLFEFYSLSIAKIHMSPTSDSYFLPASLQICDGRKLRTYRKNFCPSKLVFTANFTKINSDCFCISGVWLVVNRDCLPSVITGLGGCLLSPQIKALQHLGNVGKADFFAVVQKSKIDQEYELMRPIRMEKNVQGYVWLFNGMMNQSKDGVYCAHKRPKHLQKLKGTKFMARYHIEGRLSLQYDCMKTYSTPVEPQLEYGLLSIENSECRMDCEEIPRSRLLVKRKVQEFEGAYYLPIRFPTPPSLSKRKRLKGRLKPKPSTAEPSKIRNETDTRPRRPRPHESLVNHLHSRLLRRILNVEFPQEEFTARDAFPKYTFRILDNILRIVDRVCGGMVPRRFLRYSGILFKTLYEFRGTHMLEWLKEEEGTEILKFLNECYGMIQPVEWNLAAAPNSLTCKDDPTHFLLKGDYVPLNDTEVHSRSFFLNKRHLTLEIPWTVIDITVGTCIDAFAQSYILYHKMEQALERLFVKDLKTMWKLPPSKEKMYRRLYGPNWKQHMENLEKCVEAVYSHKDKLKRLRRPDEVITRYSSRQKDAENTAMHIPKIMAPTLAKVTKSGKVLLHSVHLSCQTFDLVQCHEQDGPGQ